MMYINGQGYAPIIKSEHNYSTDEQIVGTWIDGKTLYEKVLTYNQTITGNSNTKTTIANMPNINLINAWGHHTEYTPNDNLYQTKPITFAQTGYGQSASVSYNHTTSNVELQTKYQYSACQLSDIAIVIQYTKGA